jgi:hypothetical protein
MKKQTAAAAVKTTDLLTFRVRRSWVNKGMIHTFSSDEKDCEATYHETGGFVAKIYMNGRVKSVNFSCYWKDLFVSTTIKHPDPTSLSAESIRRAAKAFADRVRKEAGK